MIKLRKLQENDLMTRVEWMNNPKVYKTMHFIPPISIENTMKWFEKNRWNNNRVDIVFDNEDGHRVAMGGLTNIDYSVRKAEFYIFVNPEMQRKGYGVNAAYQLCKYGFEILQLHKIYLYTNSSNLGARKTYEKIGFKLEGTLRDEMINNEIFEDRLYYGLLAAEIDRDKLELILSGSPIK